MWKNGQRMPFSPLDLQYLGALCHQYEENRKQLNLVAKLKGLEEEVVNSSR